MHTRLFCESVANSREWELLENEQRMNRTTYRTKKRERYQIDTILLQEKNRERQWEQKRDKKLSGANLCFLKRTKRQRERMRNGDQTNVEWVPMHFNVRVELTSRWQRREKRKIRARRAAGFICFIHSSFVTLSHPHFPTLLLICFE